MTTLYDWYSAFDDASTWSPHPLTLTRLEWDENQGVAREFVFTYRSVSYTASYTLNVMHKRSPLGWHFTERTSYSVYASAGADTEIVKHIVGPNPRGILLKTVEAL
jgi:hypothetical protein